MKQYRENKLTIYTPTYNRGYCIDKLYKSLLSQTNQDFEWVIIDDGSNDQTQDLVKGWISEKKIIIRYFYQENKGKQEAVNLAHSLIENELNTCVDSDDYLENDAVDFILNKWKEIKSNQKLAGLVGLDRFENGEIIGTKFPDNISQAKFSEFETKYKIKGDKKFVYKTSIIHQYPKYPSIANEKFPAPGYLYRLIDEDYDLYLTNKVLCVVEYLEDGISKNKFKQFMKCPNSFAFYRLERMRLAKSFPDKFKNAVHYVNSCIFAKRNLFTDNPYIITTLLAIPLGVLLSFYIRYTNKKGMV